MLWYLLLLRYQKEGVRSLEGKRREKDIRNARKEFPFWIGRDLDLNL